MAGTARILRAQGKLSAELIDDRFCASATPNRETHDLIRHSRSTSLSSNSRSHQHFSRAVFLALGLSFLGPTVGFLDRKRHTPEAVARRILNLAHGAAGWPRRNNQGNHRWQRRGATTVRDDRGPNFPAVKLEALALRLPATLGYCAMVLCLMAFCRRRLPAVYSFVATLFACDALLFYSTEGRCYGMVLGCAAGALLCWQMAMEGRRRALSVTLLAFCLALMTALHYHAIFFLVPLAVAEIVRCRKSLKPDLAIMAAMLPAVLVLAVHYPLIRAWQPPRHTTAHRQLGPRFRSFISTISCQYGQSFCSP